MMVRVSKRQKSMKNQNPSRKRSATDQHDENEPLNDEDLNVHQKLDVALNKIQSMADNITHLINQVNELKQQVKEINQTNKSNAIDSNSTSNEGSMIADSPQMTKRTLLKMDEPSPKGPFPKYEPTDRIVPRPSTRELASSVGGKSHSLQFTTSLYVDLITKILGPTSKTGLDYKAMVKEAILITKAVLSHIKEVNNIDPDLRWSRVDPTTKLDAYRKLEAATEHLLPLKVCSEFWGAHVLISNFWLKRKKKTSSSSTQTGNNSSKRKRTTHHNAKDDSLSSPTPSDFMTLFDTTLNTNTTASATTKEGHKKLKAFSIPFLTHQ